MTYFNKFTELEKTENLPTQDLPSEAIEFVHRIANTSFEPEEDPFLCRDRTQTNTSGRFAFFPIMAVKHYVGEEKARELFERYNYHLENRTLDVGREDCRVVNVGDDERFHGVQYRQTVYDYFLNAAFARDEANNILEQIDDRHAGWYRRQDTTSLLALAHAGLTERVSNALQVLRTEKVLMENYRRTPTNNIHGQDCWGHPNPKLNAEIAMVCDMVDDPAGLRIAEHLPNWPSVDEGICRTSMQALKDWDNPEWNPVERKLTGTYVLETAVCLEMYKTLNRPMFEKTKSNMMDIFVEKHPCGFDINQEADWYGRISDYMAFLATAQEVPLFQ